MVRLCFMDFRIFGLHQWLYAPIPLIMLTSGVGFEARIAGTPAGRRVIVEKRRKEMLDSAAQWLFKEVY